MSEPAPLLDRKGIEEAFRRLGDRLAKRGVVEARAITWDEVDLKAGTVAVYRSVRVKGDTKTRKSRRVLKLPTRAVQALRAHHTRPP